MSILTHIFERLSLLLHWVVGRTSTKDFNLLSLYFDSLPRTDTFNHCSDNLQTSSGSDVLEEVFVELLNVGYNLYVLNGRTIVQGYEVDSLAATLSANPTHYGDLGTEVGALQEVYDFCTFHTNEVCLFRFTINVLGQFNSLTYPSPCGA